MYCIALQLMPAAYTAEPILHDADTLAHLQGLPLAVKALHELKRQGCSGASSACLVVAGGYDKRLAENREHFKEIQQLVSDLHMEDQVCAG